MKIGNDDAYMGRISNIGKPLMEINRGTPLDRDLKKPEAIKGYEFKNILKTTVADREGIRFSKHAKQRMQDRKIQLTEGQLDNMKDALGRARSKGVKDSLILMNNTAFIVNIPTCTVITAVDNKNIHENVFTNIDGAIII